MTVYRPKGRRAYIYDFEFRGDRYVGSTGQSTLKSAQEFERKERVRLERQSGDLSMRPQDTPRFHDWAYTFYAHKRDRIKSPERMAREISVVLEFFGAKPGPKPPRPQRRQPPPPKRAVQVAPPYHDLRLGDLIDRPELITEFESWMRARKTGGSARNHYRSVVSGMYKVARLPQYRRETGVRINPMEGIERDRPVRRRVTLTMEEVRRWILHASPHVKLALAIGALAPTLRLGSVLALEWGTHVDDAMAFITITDHKADQAHPEPIVVPIVAQLRAILATAQATAEAFAERKRRPVSRWVVSYRGRRVASIKKGLQAAAQRAGITYGVSLRGATFHTLRHTMATMLASLGVPDAHRKELLGHSDIATTQIYTHLRPMHLIGPLEQLSEVLPLADLGVGKTVGPTRADVKNPVEKPDHPVIQSTARKPQKPRENIGAIDA